jgi:hypothetical protein
MAATTELEQRLQKSAIPMNGPVFVALSQTLPCFLANAWLALLRHPAELARLGREPNLMPSAIEEMPRYVGITQKVSRYAIAPVILGDISIDQGRRVILLLDSAKRDPEQFPFPNCLELTPVRPVMSHLVLACTHVSELFSSAAMAPLKTKVDSAPGHRIPLIGT